MFRIRFTDEATKDWGKREDFEVYKNAEKRFNRVEKARE